MSPAHEVQADSTQIQTDSEQSSPVANAERLAAALAGAELEATDTRGETPIFWAARQGNAEAVRLLASSGAMIAAQNKVNVQP
jgi:ankyrin repeat protein